MRFEIRKGGAFLILVALVGLSGAVFALGLVAGYQMARQNQPDVNQTSTTYPLPAAPAEESKEEPGAETSPAQEMTTTLNGETGYRLRVGPYASSAAASAAQQKLREQYKQAYTTSH